LSNIFIPGVTVKLDFVYLTKLRFLRETAPKTERLLSSAEVVAALKAADKAVREAAQAKLQRNSQGR